MPQTIHKKHSIFVYALFEKSKLAVLYNLVSHLLSNKPLLILLLFFSLLSSVQTKNRFTKFVLSMYILCTPFFICDYILFV